MPNALATLVLIAWPFVSLAIFRKVPPGRAIIASMVLAYLFLPPPPAGWDFPLLPALTKDTIPALVAFALCLVFYRDMARWLPQTRLGRVLVFAFVFSPLATWLTNTEPAIYGQFALAGLRIHDGFAMVVQQVLIVLPLLLARAFLSGEADQRDLLWALVIGGLIYSPLMLLEVRLSPQLNIWIYGYFQHNFDQVIRDGGFRPIVFLYHALWVAFFTMTSVLAALALARVEGQRRWLVMVAVALYLLAVLVLCKSLASLIYAVVLAPVVLFVPGKLQIHFAAAMALLAIGYPAAKGADLVPQEQIMEMAESLDHERAASLRFRFDNETALLYRAQFKPLFGWGSWGRNQWLDPITGAQRTVADGRWIILIGVYGWIGFIAEFGLLALPVLMLWRRVLKGGAAQIGPLAGPLALMLGVNMIDMLPNATITPLTWLIAGGLLGYAEKLAPMRKEAPARQIETIL